MRVRGLLTTARARRAADPPDRSGVGALVAVGDDAGDSALAGTEGGEGGTTLGARQCANRFATGQHSTRAGQQPQQQGFLSRSCAGEGAMADPNSAAMAVQAQIRENNFEMQDFLRDLRGWQDDIKAKDDAAKSKAGERRDASLRAAGERMTQRYREAGGAKLESPPVAAIPPVRGRAEASALGAVEPVEVLPPVRGGTSSGGSKTKAKAGHTYDYYKDWDSFDVDGALKQADVGDSSRGGEVATGGVPVSPAAIAGSQGTSAALASARAAKARRQADPVALKDAGNAAFKRGEWDDAAKFYTRSIEAGPSAVAYANRAMARIKMELWENAEQDCTDAIALDSSYTKAWSRRGTCRRALKRHREAADDFERAVRLMPTSKELIADRRRSVEEVIKKEVKVAMPTEWTEVDVMREDGSGEEETPTSGAGATSPAVQQIPKCGQDQVAAQQEQITSSTAALRLHDEQSAGDGAPAGDLEGLLAGGDAGGASSLEALLGSGDASGLDALVGSACAGGQAGEDMAARITAAGASVTEAIGAVDAGAIPPPAARASDGASGASPLVMAAASRLAPSKLPPPPKSSYEFESAWKALGGDVTSQAAYLEALDVSELPKIFKASLDQRLLRSVLEVTAAELMPGAAVSLLEGLSGVPRFSMAIMFLSAKDKAGMTGMWEAAAAVPELVERAAKLRQVYRC